MRLTERDFDLLRFLAAQGVATADQLTARFFFNRKTCQARLHLLKKADLVESVPLTELKSVSIHSYRQALDLLLIARQDAWKFRVYRLTPRMRNRRAGAEQFAEPMMWKHQLQLNGIRNLAEDWFPDAQILTDPDIRAEASRFKMGREQPVPDLVIRFKKNEIALEIERNAKSQIVYLLRFLDYRDSQYSHVLYFCESQSIFNQVARAARGVSKIGVSRLLAPELVFQSEQGFMPTREFLGWVEGGKSDVQE